MGQAWAARFAWLTQRVRQRLAVDDRVAPLVERDPLGQQLGAHAVGLAGDRVDAHALAHRAPVRAPSAVAGGAVAAGSGSSPARRAGLAAAVPGVVGELLGERLERR